MTIESIIALSFAMFILAASPGPGVFGAVAQSLATGFRSSLDVIAGIVLGDIIFLMLAIFGLSAVAKLFGEFFFFVKIAGCLYLVWLGFKMWTGEPASMDSKPGAAQQGRKQRFLTGLFITLGNPKVILFYVGFLPTFLDLASLGVTEIAIVSGVISAVLVTVLTGYTWSAAKARRLFKSRRAAKNFNRGAGTVMIGTGIAIVVR